MPSLNDIFVDPAKGLSKGSFIAAAKRAGFTSKEAIAHYERESGAQIHRGKKKTYHSIVNPPGSWQIDLMFLDIYSGLPANRQKTGILCAIEGTSRYAWARPFRTKEASEIAKLLAELIREHDVKSVTTDDGNEFRSSVKTLFEQHNIEHYHSARKGATSKIERFNRTLRSLIQRWFTISGTHEWVDTLPDIIKNHNNTPSRVLLMHTPEEVLHDQNLMAEIRSLDYDRGIKAMKLRNELEDGAPVRVALSQTIFSKKSGPKFSPEITYVERDTTNKLLLRVRHEDGTLDRKKYAIHELLPIPGSTITSKAKPKARAGLINVPMAQKQKRAKQLLNRESITASAVISTRRPKAATPARYRD